MRGVILGGLVVLSACKHAEIPWRPSAVEAGSRARHALKVAVLPFADARAADDGDDDADHFEYRGVRYLHTRLADLRGAPLHRITEHVARSLASARVFQQVILVLEPSQAPEADLILSGQVKRARGYVEAEAPKKDSGRPPEERRVMAELVLAQVELRDAHHPQRLVFDADLGWSIDEARTTTSEGEPDPWAVLGEALERALYDFAEALTSADLTGGKTIEERVALPSAACAVTASGAPALFGAVACAPPSGWSFSATSTRSAPTGWRAAEARCAHAMLTQERTLRFHRALGPYRPQVELWACPEDQGYDYDVREELPALYLGDAEHRRYFCRAVGQSNWPQAGEQIAARLALQRPSERHIFHLAPPR